MWPTSLCGLTSLPSKGIMRGLMGSPVLLLVCALLSAVLAAAEATVIANEKQFNQLIGQGKPALVEFFAPWCGHCKTLAPTYSELADTFSKHDDKVIIAQVDGDSNRKLMSKFDIQGFPTLLWFPANAATKDVAEPVQVGRDLTSLATYVSGKIGVKSPVKAEPVKKSEAHALHAVELTPTTFDEVVFNPNKNVLVEFFAPWCGFCKRLAPDYDKAAKDFERDPEVVLAQVDADKYRDLGERFEIQSFPTLLFFPALTPAEQTEGKVKTSHPFNGDRSEDGLVQYVNSYAGTFREPGGGLSNIAGRLPALDRFLNSYIATAKEQTNEYIAELDTIAVSTRNYINNLLTKVEAGQVTSGTAKASAAKYYGRVLDKISQSHEWVTKEIARLEKILAKSADGASNVALGGTKLDQITIKLNILRATVDQKLAKSLKTVAEREKAKADKEKTDAELETAHEDL